MAGNVPSWQNLGLRFLNGSLHENLRAARQISCAASLHGKLYLKYNKNAHSMYCGECDAAIAKAAAAVTRVQSQSQEVGSGDKGWACYVLICYQQKRTFGGRRTSSRGFASSLHEKCKKP